MNRTALAILLLPFFPLLAFAQTKGATPLPPVPSETKVEILKLQLDESKILAQYNSLTSQIKDLQNTYATDSSKLSTLETAAIKAAGLSPEKVRINEQTFTFENLPTPAPVTSSTPVAAPATKSSN